MFLRFVGLLLLFISFIGCVSSPARLAAIDSSLTDLQSGRAEQGRASLQKNCVDGWTGACALLGQPGGKTLPLSIMQSVTTLNQSRFVILIGGGEKVSYYVRDMTSGAVRRVEAERFTHHGSTAAVDQVEVFDLDPKKAYQLIVLGPKAALWDRREFHSLDPSKRRPRIAVASCMDDRYRSEQLKIWPELLKQKPDALFLIGDNVYVDHGPLEGVDGDFIWRRYVETRTSLEVFRANPLVPVFAVWDDHDFGKNDGDRTFRYKNESADVFYAFFAQKKPAGVFERGPGLSSWLSAYGVHFAFLDDRTFRSPDRVELPDQTHFGVEQEQWVDGKLASAHEPTFLISGDQFFGGYQPFESYEGNHPKSFKERLEAWRKVKVPLIFLSGDRHLAEVMKLPVDRLGYTTYEMTSSGIHARVFADAFQKNPSPQQIAGAAGQFNYMIVEIMRAAPGFLQLDVQSFTLGGKQLLQKTLTVKHE